MDKEILQAELERLNSASGEAVRWNVELEGFATVNRKKDEKWKTTKHNELLTTACLS